MSRKLNKYARVVRSNQGHARSAAYFDKFRSSWYLRDANYHRGVARVQKGKSRRADQQYKQIIWDHSWY